MADEATVTAEAVDPGDRLGLPETVEACEAAMRASRDREAELRAELAAFKRETDDAVELENRVRESYRLRKADLERAARDAAANG